MGSKQPTPGDPDLGLATQRTSLAWQRTALATITGAAVMARLTFDRLGLEALVTLGAALVLSGWIMWESHTRFRTRATRTVASRSRSGRATLALSLAVVLMAVTELAAITDQVSLTPHP